MSLDTFTKRLLWLYEHLPQPEGRKWSTGYNEMLDQYFVRLEKGPATSDESFMITGYFNKGENFEDAAAKVVKKADAPPNPSNAFCDW